MYVGMFHEIEITKEMVQFRSEKLFVPYSKHCVYDEYLTLQCCPSCTVWNFDSLCATSLSTLYFVIGL